MARSIRGQEFANRAADSRYPLIPAATALDTTSQFTIPNDFLAGLYLSIPADTGFDAGSFRVSKVIYARARCSVFISANVGSTVYLLGQFDVLEQLATSQLAANGYAFSLFTPADGFGDVRGRLMVGGIDSLKLQPQGVYEFTQAAAGISTDCIRPMLRRVSAIEVVNSSGQTYRLTGTVRLRAGDNASLTIETVDGLPVVVFDAVDGSQLNDQLQCDTASGTIVRRINGLPGNNQGEVTLLGSNCLTVQPQQTGLQLLNACSEPCASCSEAEALKSLVDPFVTQVPTLVSLANRIDMAVTQFQLNALASQGNACGSTDDPCDEQTQDTQVAKDSADAFDWFKRSL